MKKFLYIFAPIQDGEWKRFLSMGLMLFFILFNYNVLRSVKDSLIVPNIGAEAISFIKTFVITPASLGFMILYSFMSHFMKFENVFYYIASFFIIFFLAFAFAFYPYQNFFHPDPSVINQIIHSNLHFGFITIDMDHLKWFLKLYSKWTFVTFYIIAELWGSAMIFMLYWQLANNITSTDQAKRLYPMCGFIGHIGSTLGGVLISYFATANIGTIDFFGTTYHDGFILITMITVSFATLCSLGLFIYVKNNVVKKEQITIHHRTQSNKPDALRSRLSVSESFKIIFSTRYLWLIITIVFAYGISINILEGVWKSKAKYIYIGTNNYAAFMGDVMMWTGICTMTFMIVGSHILKKLGWFFGAMVTPVVMFITGIGFFVFVVFSDYFSPFVSAIGSNVLLMAVHIGAIQNILTKGTKYSLFDATKEMTYIPASAHIKSKGKAAIDVVGARWAKSGGALIQSLLFSIFPMANYDTIAPYLMILFIIFMSIWIYDLCILRKEYQKKLEYHHQG